jgi:hypothetical protein
LIALAIGLTVASCGGRGGNQQSGTETTETKTDAVYTIPRDEISGSETAIAEIPNEIFKAIGKLTYCMVNTSGVKDGYKYNLSIRTSNEDTKADLEKLLNYYKSIGGTVEKSDNIWSDYDVKLDYAESVTIEGLELSYIQIQFSVVKQ